MEELELLQADLGVDLVHESADALGRANVVPRREQMTRVDAEPKALWAARLLDQLRRLVEVTAKELGRAGGVLVDDRAALRARQRLLDQVDRPPAGVGPGVVLESPGVHHHPERTDPVADPQCMSEGVEA